jgi:coenzyme F420-reducing hydrogenase delta subunit
MSEPVSPDIIVYLCHNCVPEQARLPRQWRQQGAHVLTRVVPCSGKMDGQYLFHGLEGGAWGLCVVTCPKGECRLAQGNYRAEIRVGTVRRLLGEIGIEPERAQFVQCSPDDPPHQFEQSVRGAVERICALGPSPVAAGDTVCVQEK